MEPYVRHMRATEVGPIVVGWDGSTHAEDALELGRVLGRAIGSEVMPVEVSVAHRHALRRRAEQPVAVGATQDHRAVTSSSAADGLHELAEDAGAGLIVIGSTHHGALGRVFMGTVAADLLRGSPCPVVIAPRGYARRYANRLLEVVVVGYDASPEARVAAEFAARIASAAAASLRVIAVLEPPPLAAMNPGAGYGVDDLMADEAQQLDREVAGLVESLPPDLAPEGRVISGDAARTLVSESAQGVDLLVLGSRGHGALGRTLLGSVSAEIVRSASCPVMVVPHGADED
jgi:nucleotide-binding universal stress UspA family protein